MLENLMLLIILYFSVSSSAIKEKKYRNRRRQTDSLLLSEAERRSIRIQTRITCAYNPTTSTQHVVKVLRESYVHVQIQDFVICLKGNVRFAIYKK